MSLFRKIFGNSSESTNEEKGQKSPYTPEENTPVDEMFTNFFKKMVVNLFTVKILKKFRRTS